MAADETVFVSWTPHHRAEDIARKLAGTYYVPARWARKLPAPVRYAVQALTTIVHVARRRPTAVIFTNPPFVAGVACLIAGRLTGAQVWADCHSGAFNDPRWSRFVAANRWVLQHCDGTIFHNFPQAREWGGSTPLALTITTDGMRDRSTTTPRTPGPLRVVIPASYAFDEPIGQLLAAAALLPDQLFVFTGRAPASVVKAAPQNVEFTGWVDAARYHKILADASIVVCLTTRASTMQGGVLEALEHACPAVTSATDALVEWCDEIDGIVLIPDHQPTTIAAAIARIVADHQRWQVDAGVGRTAALARASSEIDRLKAALR